MKESKSLVESAADFAERAHSSINQLRRTGEPYIVHPRAVARIVAKITDDQAMIAAAWLHDVVEDTPVEMDAILEEFGEEVANLVDDLTDVSKPEDGNRAARKAKDREHTASASAKAKTIKLADILANLDGIADLARGFAFKYIRESELLLEVLRDGDLGLYKRVHLKLDSCRKALESKSRQ